MASHPTDLYPGNNELKASDQHRKGNISPGSRKRLEENHGIEAEVEEQGKSCISSESTAHLNTLKPTALVPSSTADTDSSSASTATSRIPTMHSAASRQETKLTSREQTLASLSSTPAVEVLNISSQTEVAVGPNKPKSKAPNMSLNLKADVGANIPAKTSPKNIQKTASTPRITACPKNLHKTASVSQISFTDSPKSLNRMSLTHIPRASSNPKLKASTTASLKVNNTELNSTVRSPKERVINRLAESKLQMQTNAAMVESVQEIKRRNEQKEDDVGKTGGEVALQSTQLEHSFTGSDITMFNATGCKNSPPPVNEIQPSHQVTNLCTERLKNPEDKSHANVTTQESKKEKKMERQAEKRERYSQKRQERETGESIKDEKAERKKDADRTATQIKKEKTLICRKLNEAKMITAEVCSVVETQDEALQTDLWPVYVDAEVQVFVEVAGKYTDMSPIHSPQSCVQLNPKFDLMSKVDLHNELRPNRNSDVPTAASPDPTPKEAKPRFLGPPPYKAPNIQKPVKHVCQIEIELCSPMPQCVSSAPPSITVSQCDAVCNEQMNREKKNSVKTTEMEGENEGSVAPQDIVWDEQGMTWEVYGASLDLESLGFAIQNHLQCKIREHERRIRTLRKSICLSEQSAGKSRTEKRNVFRSLFSGCKCCSNPRPKQEMAK